MLMLRSPFDILSDNSCGDSSDKSMRRTLFVHHSSSSNNCSFSYSYTTQNHSANSNPNVITYSYRRAYNISGTINLVIIRISDDDSV